MLTRRHALARLSFALAALGLSTLLLPSPLLAQQTPGAPLQREGKQLLLRGKPFQIISGELEYARIPREYWRDRLRKARALGLNSITVYVFWNLHEPQPGHFDFSGQNDVAEFLREAQQEGLLVILRPGPYVCAEWDLGGYPAWLLKDHHMVLRSSQPAYMQAAQRWIKRLGQELAPLQASHGGPILAVQVENEYGSFGNDARYMEQMEATIRAAGFDSSLLYTADGGDVMQAGSLPDLFAGVDFGTGDAARSLALLKKFRPDAPVYVAEYWDGWFDHWGEKHQVTDAAKQEEEIQSMLEEGDSLSLYMVHGGTSFGWMNGANSDHGRYQPDVSSYDYDAPLDESGRPRPKYFRMREIIEKATHQTPPVVPESAAMMTFPALKLEQARSLWQTLPEPLSSPVALSMEDVDQSYGYLLYRSEIKATGDIKLSFEALHNYARVYLDGVLQGSVDRRLGQTALMLHAKGRQRLDVLVENSGRINFTTAIRGERAGVLGAVTVGERPQLHWKIYRLPFAQPPGDGYTTASCSGPCLYRASLELKQPGDTFLNTQALAKGVIWVNGHLLGRFWNVGPMGSLYLPGVWLHSGSNEVIVLDLDGGTDLQLSGEDHPTYIQPRSESTVGEAQKGTN